jgi:ActR/RegA family two-component response regulator/AraC-like DNA-binding protein
MHDIFSGAVAEPDSSRVPLYAGMAIADGSGPLVQTSSAARSSASFPRVLWIDDEIGSDDAAVWLMKFEGVDVDCAQSGIAGLSLALTSAYDGIILDVRLPELGGMRILERLVAAGMAAPVLMLTGFGDVETAVNALKAGAADFRNKPVLGDELAIVMKTLIGRSPVRSRDASQRPRDDGSAGAAPDDPRDAGTLPQAVVIMIKPDLTVVEFVVLVRAFRQQVTGRRLASRHQARKDHRAQVGHSLEDATTVLHRMAADIAARRMPSVGRIADACAADRVDIGEVLFTATGSGFRECRRALRVRPSLAHVAFGDEQFAQIAYRLGYNHASQFDRDFVLAFGLSPREMRQLGRSV